jgi:hypothetical protein
MLLSLDDPRSYLGNSPSAMFCGWERGTGAMSYTLNGLFHQVCTFLSASRLQLLTYDNLVPFPAHPMITLDPALTFRCNYTTFSGFTSFAKPPGHMSRKSLQKSPAVIGGLRTALRWSPELGSYPASRTFAPCSTTDTCDKFFGVDLLLPHLLESFDESQQRFGQEPLPRTGRRHFLVHFFFR